MVKGVNIIAKTTEFQENVISAVKLKQKTSVLVDDFIEFLHRNVEHQCLTESEHREIKELGKVLGKIKNTFEEGDKDHVAKVAKLIESIVENEIVVPDYQKEKFSIDRTTWESVTHIAEDIMNRISWKIAGIIKEKVYFAYSTQKKFNEYQSREKKIKAELEAIEKGYSDGFKELLVTETNSAINTVLDKENNTYSFSEMQKELLTALEKKRGKYQGDLFNYKKQQKLEEELKDIKTHESGVKRGRDVKKIFTAIGGKRLTLEAKDKTKLDATFISANSFREKIIAAGGRQFQASVGGHELTGIIVNKNDHHGIYTHLSNLNGFDFAQNHGAGISAIEYNSELLIVSQSSAKQLLEDKFIRALDPKSDYSRFELIDSPEISYTDIESVDKPGTVILLTGSAANYAMGKEETLAFLLMGMNVMMVDVRGSGESDGIPSEKGYYHDIEAAYQYVRSIGTEDEQIIAKGLCLSCGVVSHLAKNHPKINLILDRTYSEFRETAISQIDGVLDELEEENETKKSLILYVVLRSFAKIMANAIKYALPDFSVQRNIPDIEGHVLIISAKDDPLTPPSVQKEMLEKISRKKNLQRFQFGIINGGHHSRWVSADEKDSISGQDLMRGYLENIGMLSSLV